MSGESSFHLNALDIGIILASLLLVVVAGLWASRKQSGTARDYFLASGRLPWYIIGAAFVSTSVSSEQIVGTVGQAYKHGMGIANWEWWSWPVYSVLIAVFIPVYPPQPHCHRARASLETVQPGVRPHLQLYDALRLRHHLHGAGPLRGLADVCDDYGVELLRRPLVDGVAGGALYRERRAPVGDVDRRRPVRHARGRRPHTLLCGPSRSTPVDGAPWPQRAPNASTSTGRPTTR